MSHLHRSERGGFAHETPGGGSAEWYTPPAPVQGHLFKETQS